MAVYAAINNTGKVVDVLLLLDPDRAIKLLQIIIKD